jgi:hypothetical protein
MVSTSMGACVSDAKARRFCAVVCRSDRISILLFSSQQIRTNLAMGNGQYSNV